MASPKPKASPSPQATKKSQVVVTTGQGSTIKMDLLATFFCYIFLIFGLNYFIIKRNHSVLDAFLLGLVIYGVYETTTKALFHKWSWLTVIIDTLWGGILFALTTIILKLLR